MSIVPVIIVVNLNRDIETESRLLFIQAFLVLSVKILWQLGLRIYSVNTDYHNKLL